MAPHGEVDGPGRRAAGRLRRLARAGRRAAGALAAPLPRRRYRDVALEQAALHRVATVVARSGDPADVYETVCREVNALVGVPMSAVSRFHEGRRSEMLATAGVGHDTADVLCCALWDRGTTDAAALYRAGRTLHLDDTLAVPTPDAQRYAAYGIRSVAGAPVFVEGELWGAVTVGATVPHAIPADSARRLEHFAELVALAVANAEARATLAEQATSDPLTGLANHRRFHEELRAEVARAARHGWPLALLLLDVDNFKEINDAHGHLAGDEVLRALAGTLRGAIRDGELVARLGGDEFAAVLPNTGDEGAEALAHRVRAAFAEDPVLSARDVTVSVGVTDLDHADDADSLVRLADGALYWAKEHGRNAVWRFSPDVMDSLSAHDRAERLARGQALAALRALARAQDLRDPSTRRHADRVCSLALRIAQRLGWDAADLRRLGEAARLHDIGKITIPDRILHKPGALDPEEYEAIKAHASLGAEIVSEALDEEQVLWVQHHHERWDGRGYPGGLRESEIPSGALIIGLADAFDVMTTARHYRQPVSEEEALEEVRRERGRQFCAEAVEALEAVIAAGEGLRSAA